MSNAAEEMRSFWDERARENAAWYVDTTCDYSEPDMEKFFAVGRDIVSQALLNAPAQPRGRARAVEIGPGLGRVCAALADHFDEVVGVDISTEMVERARRLVPNQKVRFEVGDGMSLEPLPSGSADFVMTFTVLQHLTSAELVYGYLRDSARLLAPGGVIAAQWNNLAHPLAWRSRITWQRLRHRIAGSSRREPTMDRAFVGTRVPFSGVRKTLEESGLQIAGTQDLGTLFAWVWAVKPTD